MQLRQEPKLNKVLEQRLEQKSKYLPEFGDNPECLDEAVPRSDYYYRLLPVFVYATVYFESRHSLQK